MRVLQYTIVLALSISLLAGFTPHAFAGIPPPTTAGCESEGVDNFAPPTGASPPGPEQEPQCIPNQVPPATWIVDLVTLSFVPGAGPWVKALDVPPNLNFDILLEDIEVGAGPDWTDWHEEIQTPDWIFTEVTIVTDTGELHVILGPTTDVWVDFDNPLPPGTLITIEKSLTNIGAPIPVPSVIIIWEYPTIDEAIVGGELLSINSAALLLAGLQTSAIWLAPVVISAVGISLVLIRRK